MLEPQVVKIDKDSIPTYTPGKNGIPLPTIVKAPEADIKQYPFSAIVPGVSYLPQTEEEIILGKEKIMTIKPKKVKVNRDSLRFLHPVYPEHL